jgi:hypothetical protein
VVPFPLAPIRRRTKQDPRKDATLMSSGRYDIVVRGGTVATASDVFRADVGIRGETIAAIASTCPPARGRSTLRASSFYPAASIPTPMSSSSPRPG